MQKETGGPIRAGHRPKAGHAPEAIVIAASTGGPQALATFFAGLSAASLGAPIFVVLHMPEQLTNLMTAQIERISGRPTLAGAEGAAALPGHIYLAPGNKHLSLRRKGLAVTMHVDSGELVNYCRPSADVLFRSAAKAYGGNVAAVILSGMGADGCEGAKEIADAGGEIIAQDRETSAVWGMPAAVVEAGIARFVLPLESIASHIERMFRGGIAGTPR